ncbi:LSM domain-containing protein [Colletotrichum camelliae]|nr:LSM domain-containing protein [Colletotrichum camelliae]
MAPAQPELKKVRRPVFLTDIPESPDLYDYLDKRLFVQLNGSRKVIGVLRGYDVFLNIVLDEAVEEKEGGEKVRLGMVVIRGNSVVMLEALERIGGDDRQQRG